MKKLRVIVDGKAYEVSVQILDEGNFSGGTVAAPAPVQAATPAPAPKPAAAPASAPSAAAPGDVPSPLAGKVVSIDAQVGQAVKEGQQLVTLEAMKMNTYIYAPKAGTVSKVLVNPGDLVEEGQGLVTLS